MNNNIIDLNLLHSNSVEKIEIDSNYQIPSSYYENSSVSNLKDVYAKGYITRIDTYNDKIVLHVEGSMEIIDSISLKPVWYPFSFDISDDLKEIYTNSSNTLDIFELLWENIVLEVPLRYTLEKDYNKFKGDGWSLKSEDEEKHDNPFNDILKEFGKE